MSDELCPPHQRRSVEALGVETNYYESGSRENRPVLLLHGMSSSADSFRELMHRLADSYWIVAPDIPGFGHSAEIDLFTAPHLVEWLAGFLDRLRLPEIDLVGHSFGGFLAASFAVTYPEYVRSLFMLAPAILAADRYPSWARASFSPWLLESLGDAGLAVAKRTILQWQLRAPFFNPGSIADHVWSRREDDYRNARVAGSVLSAVAEHDVAPALAELERPMALAWGEEDRVLPATDARRLDQLLPQVSVTLIPECGHAPMIEKTERVATMMRDFWESIDE